MDLLGIIRRIVADKRQRRIEPAFALEREILQVLGKTRVPYTFESFNAELAALCDWGEIIAHPTINDNTYELTDQQI